MKKKRNLRDNKVLTKRKLLEVKGYAFVVKDILLYGKMLLFLNRLTAFYYRQLHFVYFCHRLVLHFLLIFVILVLHFLP